jgi:hypothetical protein
MPLTEQQKNYIVNLAVEVLKSENRKERLEELRTKVMSDSSTSKDLDLDDAVYSVLQAIEELYGK